MKKVRLLWMGVLVALVLVAIPLFSAFAQDTMPLPIDPQSWKLQEDMTWEDLKPNPVINWMTELNPAGLVNPKATGNKDPIRGALLLVDYWDRPFVTTEDLHTDLLGFYLYDKYGKYTNEITKNPIMHVDANEYTQWIADYLNKNQELNHNRSIDEYWRESSYGKWAIELDSYGPYTLQGCEFEFSPSYNTYTDFPPTFRRGATGTSGSRSLVNESIALAYQKNIYLGDYDFFFILHAGYDESNVWYEFGMMQWAKFEDIPYEYGPGAKMEQIEQILTENPELLLNLETTTTSYSSTTPVLNGYNQNTVLRNAVAEVKQRKADGTLDQFQFKFPQADWNWVNTYSWKNASPTRYVAWTSWIAAMSCWSASSSATVPRSPGNGGGSRSVSYSQQGESDAMGTFAHEFGHIVSHADNYEATMWTQNVSPKTDYWDLMSRGDKVGPGGYHARWNIPGGQEAGGSPGHMMMFPKMRSSYYDTGDLLELTVAQLKTRTPVVANVVSRNIPLNNNKTAANPNGLYPQLEEYGLTSPNYYKGVVLTFDSANADKATLQTTGWSWTRYRAARMGIEVVDTSGYDSFQSDHGVLLSRIDTGQNRTLIDSHLYDIKLVDFYLGGTHPYDNVGGEPVYYCIGHADQLDDALFHAGKSVTDNGYYEGSQYRGDKRVSDKIVSGDTVNEFYDRFNGIHVYILNMSKTPAKYGDFLSYQVAVRHDAAPPVNGELNVAVADIERETPTKVAVANFSITNTGNATDIIRVGVEGYLDPTILNNLYAVGAGETITVPVYVQLPGDIRTKDLSGKTITLSAASETNGAKYDAATVKVSDLIAYNYQLYLTPDQSGVYAGETVNVDVMLVGDLNYTQVMAEIAYDTSLLKYEGYTYLNGIVAAVSPLNGKVSVRSVPSLNMVFGEPCIEDVKIATLKFSTLDSFNEDKVITPITFASALVSPPAGVVGAGTAPGRELPFTIYENDFTKSFYNNLALYPEWIGLDDQGLPTTMPIFSYSSNYITERVWVEVPVDTDRDGKRDRVSLWIRRPVTKEGFKCPVVMEFSPYHNGTRGYTRMSNYINSTDEHLRALAQTFRYHDNYPVSIGINPDTTNLTYDDIKYTGTEAWDPVWWQSNGPFAVNSWYTGVPYGTVPAATVITGVDKADSITWAPTPGGSGIPARWQHYFVRGYAMVFGQLLGSRDSEGITNTMHMEEWLSAAAAARWFNGESKAFKTRDGSVEVIADWASGLVGMDGTSYPGTTPVIAAASGVTGLKAIMPESCPASQYEYYRSGGGLHCPDGYGGEDMNLHSSFNFSRIDADLTASTNNNVIPPPAGPWFDMTAQKAYIETQQYMMKEQDRDTGDYNAEWDARNLTRGYAHIPSDVGILQTSGQQDWNVMPIHAYQMLQAMRDNFQGNDPAAYGTHKQVSGLSAHASQSGRLVPGKDGVERGMLKWYLMFLDHFLLKLDNHVDDLMYDIYIANNITGVMEGYDYDTEKEERGTIIPGTHFENIFMTPGPDGKAGRLSYTAPTAKVDHFADMDIHGMLTAPLHLGVSGTGGTATRPANTVGTISGQGNRMITAATGQWCEDRMIGVNRTYNTTNDVIFNVADQPLAGRLLYLSEPLTERVQMSGAPVLYLQAAPDRGMGTLSVAIVELGRKARGGARTGSSATAASPALTVFPAENGAAATTAARYANPVGGSTTNFKYVTWGHTDVQNPSYDNKAWFEVPEHNYTPNYFFQTTLIEPGKYYNYVVGLTPSNYTFEVGTIIGVMIYGTDPLYTPLLTPECSAEFDVKLGADSYITIPFNKAPVLEATTVEEIVEIIETASEEIVEEVIE